MTIGTYDQIAAKLTDRFGKVVTHCEFSIAVKTDADKEQLRDLAKMIESQSLDPVRKTILGATA